MKPKDIRNKFNQVLTMLPEELVSQAEVLNKTYSMALHWPNGKLTFSNNRGYGEFALHIEGISFYQEYPVFSETGAIDEACLHDLIDDAITYAEKLGFAVTQNEKNQTDNVVYLS